MVKVVSEMCLESLSLFFPTNIENPILGLFLGVIALLIGFCYHSG